MPLYGYFSGLSSIFGIEQNASGMGYAHHGGLIGRFRIVIVRISELVGMRRAGT
jgi:hypothetical protein